MAFTLLKLYDFWIYYVTISVLVWRRGHAQARKSAQRLREKARQRALPRLAAALVEFQKAQCYFMLAVQIAAMVTLSQGQFQSDSLQQLYNNWGVVHVVSISGFLPVTFTLLCLHSVGKRSWYLTILSTITVAVSAATLSMTGSFSPTMRDVAYLAGNPSTVPSCGYHDPSVYCLERSLEGSAFGSDSANVILIYSFIILAYVVVDLLNIPEARFYLRCRAWFQCSTVFRIIAPLMSKILSAAHRIADLALTCLEARKEHWNQNTPRVLLLLRNGLAAGLLQMRGRWWNVLIYLLYTTAWVLYIFFFLELIGDYALFLLFGMVNRSWNFGQIVGITVWAEPLVEYAYLELSMQPFMLNRIVHVEIYN